MHAGELPSAIGYHGLITVYGFFLPVATGSYGLFTVNHVYEACWSDRVQTGGQVERGIPIGIPTKNQNSSLNYKSINYQIDSNYPGKICIALDQALAFDLTNDCNGLDQHA